MQSSVCRSDPRELIYLIYNVGLDAIKDYYFGTLVEAINRYSITDDVGNEYHTVLGRRLYIRCVGETSILNFWFDKFYHALRGNFWDVYKFSGFLGPLARRNVNDVLTIYQMSNLDAYVGDLVAISIDDSKALSIYSSNDALADDPCIESSCSRDDLSSIVLDTNKVSLESDSVVVRIYSDDEDQRFSNHDAFNETISRLTHHESQPPPLNLESVAIETGNEQKAHNDVGVTNLGDKMIRLKMRRRFEHTKELQKERIKEMIREGPMSEDSFIRRGESIASHSVDVGTLDNTDAIDPELYHMYNYTLEWVERTKRGSEIENNK